MGRSTRYGLLASVGLLAAGCLAGSAVANADALAYLVNVTVRPGYDFTSAEDALAYGHQLCDEVAAVHGYAQIIDEIRSHFGTSDYYQATYLINQAVNKLCPAQIFALRNSAASYVPPAA